MSEPAIVEARRERGRPPLASVGALRCRRRTVSAQCDRILIEAITSETKAMCATDRTDWKKKLPIVGTNTAPWSVT